MKSVEDILATSSSCLLTRYVWGKRVYIKYEKKVI